MTICDKCKTRTESRMTVQVSRQTSNGPMVGLIKHKIDLCDGCVERLVASIREHLIVVAA